MDTERRGKKQRHCKPVWRIMQLPRALQVYLIDYVDKTSNVLEPCRNTTAK
jgi:hypothetical protein